MADTTNSARGREQDGVRQPADPNASEAQRTADDPTATDDTTTQNEHADIDAPNVGESAGSASFGDDLDAPTVIIPLDAVAWLKASADSARVHDELLDLPPLDEGLPESPVPAPSPEPSTPESGHERADDSGQDSEWPAAAFEPTPEQATPGADDSSGPASTPAPPSAPSTPVRAASGIAPMLGRHEAVREIPQGGGWRILGRALRPRFTMSQVVVGILCAVLGFALVVQLSQRRDDRLASLRQSDLVRLLDEVTQRSDQLSDQVDDLETTRNQLRSGTDSQRAALALAEKQAQTQGILSGRLPAQGPGIRIQITESAPIKGFALFNILEELRNAGAEVIEVNGVRLVTHSSFVDTPKGILTDGTVLKPPYVWTAIGDPSTMETALEIPGGAMAAVRSSGARTTITQEDKLTVTATVVPATPKYATPSSQDND